ncbi:hypothetical protein E2562_016890 [Oryza meyeriana var. granulata]|uniref:KIB1-4 beta-propeller domain-containing protein n=1 Tax=Oryza meyeriana var. granulata TaxID=110450 RepID=A0A6G1DZG5_9ORYZ|nr:hypothetical protein E2562_016890 [Oryza meyeriana var. granulata]
MVVRCSPHPGEPTSAFKVFRMVLAEPPAADVVQFQHYIWRELPSLDGRMLFVGHGCSRSYEADQYPVGIEGIYFFDDRVIQDPVMLQQGGAPLYRCSDSGKWTEAPPQVDRCFPVQGPSNYSPQEII